MFIKQRMIYAGKKITKFNLDNDFNFRNGKL
jgi:hypothetical protein